MEKQMESPRKLSSYSIFPATFSIIFHWRSFCALVPFLRTVISDFFMLQFRVKFGWKRIQVMEVQHECDEYVPFVPEKIYEYLDFVKYWIRPLSMLARRRGKRAVPYIARFISLLRACYRQAAQFYRFRMSTTPRPKEHINFRFWLIHAFDPHFMCVPSLHVSIVVLTYTYFRTVFAELGFSQEEQNAWNTELYNGASGITETVLYVRQHSVNCISTALYMMHMLVPDLFSIEEAVSFMDHLFIDAPDIPAEKREKLIAYMNFLFERMLLEGVTGANWDEPLQRWILSYSAFQKGS